MYCAASFRFNLSVFGFRYPKCCKNPQGVKMKKSPKRPDLAYGSQTISAHITHSKLHGSPVPQSVFNFFSSFKYLFFFKDQFFQKTDKRKNLGTFLDPFFSHPNIFPNHSKTHRITNNGWHDFNRNGLCKDYLML